MPNQSIKIIIISFAVFCAFVPVVACITAPAWAADQSVAPAMITLDATNEPLRSVLEKITRKTKWQIKAPDKWLDRPVTQTLNKVTLEEGLRSVLKNVGIENLFLMYDEYFKMVTVFDTDSLPTSAATQTKTPQPVVSVPVEPDPRLQSTARETRPRTSRAIRRSRQSSEDD